jgi:hypothetical protein
LAFATTAVDAPHRIETPAPLLYRGIPVRAVRAVRADPKVDLHVPDSSLGVHRSPLRRHDRPASTSRPGRRLGFAPGLPRPGCAPFLPFLPASTVSPQRPDPKIRPFDGSRVCCTPQPAMGFTTFRTPWHSLSAEPRPEGLRPEGPGSRPLWRRPYEAFPSSAALPCRHRAASFRTRSRSPTGVPSRRFSRTRYRVATARRPARRPQGFLPPRSPLRCARRCRCAPARCSLGLWIDHVLDAAAQIAPPRLSRDVSPRGPAASASLDPNVERRQWSSGLVWLRA